jgi:glycosyltransferase involved in cell wall biosynthesis
MEAVAFDLATTWARRGAQVEIVTTAIPGQERPFIDRGVRIVPLSGTKPAHYTRDWWSRSAEYWRSADASHSTVLSVSAAAKTVAEQRGHGPSGPFVFQAHGTSEMELLSKLRSGDPKSYCKAAKNLAWWPRDLLLYKKFDRVVAIGQNVLRSLDHAPQRWCMPNGRADLIPNGVSPGEVRFDMDARRRVRQRLGIPERSYVACTVGRLHPQKRTDRAIEAVSSARRMQPDLDFRLLVVGSGDDEVRLRAVATRTGVADSTIFTGAVNRSDVSSFYSAADVFIMTTSRVEGLPMSVLEALASGLPCIIPPSLGGIESQWDTIDFVDPKNAQALAVALIRARGQQKSARSSTLPAEYHLETAASSYLDLFERVSLEIGARASRVG